MASLSVGSNNFPTRVYENPSDLINWLASEMLKYDVKPEIEAFDLSHILQAAAMPACGQLAGTPYVQFVMGVKNAMPADRDMFEYYIKTVNRLFPGAPWCAAGIGAAQIVLNEGAVASGGHARTGLEDNVRLDKSTLAPSNAALVRRVVALCDKYQRPVATWAQARAMLGLRPHKAHVPLPASPAESALYRQLFGDDETALLFTDSAEVRAMMLVEGTLASVQGALGVIPATAAAFLHRASLELQIDPAGLAAETATNGVPVPALVAAFRKAAQAPEHTAWLHWGATSQDIMDTGLALRLKPLLDLWEARLTRLIATLGQLAASHATLPMAARTFGQAATPTSFGAVVASWGRPLLRHRAKMDGLRKEMLQVSLSGAAGTLSAMGPQGPAVRAALAQALGLADPGASWHAERDGIASFAAWMAGLTASLGKIGADLILLAQTGIAEVAVSGAGASSTMPQKQNPVAASVLVALARHTAGLAATLQGAAVHSQQRDGAAWFTEWLTLPQLCVSTGRALALAGDVATRIAPDPAAMAHGLAQDGGLIHAEALTFALARQMPRPEAAVAIKALVAEVRAGAGDLLALARLRWPALDLSQSLGTAPGEAHAFARAARP